MGRPRKERPDGLLIFSDTLRAARIVPPEMAGRVLQSAAALFLEDQQPEIPEDLAERLLLSDFQGDIEQSFKRFERTCERNRANASNRQSRNSAPVATSGNQWQPGAPTELNQVESNQTESNQTESNAAPGRDLSRRGSQNEPDTNIPGQDTGSIPAYIKGFNLDG